MGRTLLAPDETSCAACVIRQHTAPQVCAYLLLAPWRRLGGGPTTPHNSSKASHLHRVPTAVSISTPRPDRHALHLLLSAPTSLPKRARRSTPRRKPPRF